jgi:hypothetical protein
MRIWAFGVLFVCWIGLSAVAWLSGPSVFDWATHHLAVLAGLIGLSLVFLVTSFRSVRIKRSAAPEATVQPATASAPGSREANAPAPRALTRPLYIKPPVTLVNSGARFGVAVTPHGAGIRDVGARSGQEIYFTKLDDRGTLMAQIPYDHQRRPRLKYFVDYKGLKFEAVRRALTARRFILVNPRADRHFRAWFSLPETKIGRAVDASR